MIKPAKIISLRSRNTDPLPQIIRTDTGRITPGDAFVADRAVLGSGRSLPPAGPALRCLVAGQAIIEVHTQMRGQVLCCNHTRVADACCIVQSQAEPQRERPCIPACW